MNQNEEQDEESSTGAAGRVGWAGRGDGNANDESQVRRARGAAVRRLLALRSFLFQVRCVW